MYNHKAQLVPVTYTISAIGDPTETEGTAKNVYCRVVSADEKEKTYADSRGEKAELVIILADKKAYSDEKYVKHNNIKYKVQATKFGDNSKEIRLVVGRWD